MAKQKSLPRSMKVRVEFISPKNAGPQIVSVYKDKDGKERVIDYITTPGLDGKPPTKRPVKWTITPPAVTLDLTNPDDKKKYEFIKDYPSVTGDNPTLKVTNVAEKAKAENDNMMLGMEASAMILKLDENEKLDLAAVLGKNVVNEDAEVCLNAILTTAKNTPERILKHLKDPLYEYHVVLKRGLCLNLFKLSKGTYMYEELTMGVREMEAVQWLKDNAPVYDSIKEQIYQAA